MGTTQRIKSNGFLALPVTQKSASSTGGGPSGEFGAMNSPRLSRPQPPTGGTDGIQQAAGSPTTPGWCRPAHARAGGVVLGLVYRSAGKILPAARCRRAAAARSIARENPTELNPTPLG
jgi:hypothetical protein